MQLTKICPKCETEKATECFSKDRSTKDGLSCWCRLCRADSQRRRLQTEAGRATHRAAAKRHRNTEHGRAKYLAYIKTEKAKESVRKSTRRYRQTERGKAKARENHRRYYQRHPEKERARARVNKLVSQGKIPRVNTLQCSQCEERAQQYHHHRGYEREFWLDVIPVCRECHIKLDRQLAIATGVRRDSEGMASSQLPDS